MVSQQTKIGASEKSVLNVHGGRVVIVLSTLVGFGGSYSQSMIPALFFNVRYIDYRLLKNFNRYTSAG